MDHPSIPPRNHSLSTSALAHPSDGPAASSSGRFAGIHTLEPPLRRGPSDGTQPFPSYSSETREPHGRETWMDFLRDTSEEPNEAEGRLDSLRAQRMLPGIHSTRTLGEAHNALVADARKRRSTAPENPARRVGHSPGRPYGVVPGSTMANAIDLTSSPGRSSLRRPSGSAGRATQGAGTQVEGSGASTDRRRESEIVLPRWQPDSEVSKCPVCGTGFGFWYRKHHCRRCGRVVCANCSPHRITIPRQFIVQPPTSPFPALGSNYIDLTNDGELRDTTNRSYTNSALGGGEEVRVCNPCVPDPNFSPPPQRTLDQRIPNLLDAESQTRRQQHFNLDSPQHLSYDALTQLLRNPQSSGYWPFPMAQENDGGVPPASRSQHQPQNAEESRNHSHHGVSTAAEQPSMLGQPHRRRPSSGTDSTRPTGSRMVGASGLPFTQNTNMTPQGDHRLTSHLWTPPTRPTFLPASYSGPSSHHAGTLPPPRNHFNGRMIHPRHRSASGIQTAQPYRPGSLVPSGAPSPSMAPPPPPRTTSRRPKIAEEDECPVCHYELPPKGTDGSETAREAHVQECIQSHFSTASGSNHPSPSTAVQAAVVASAAGPADASGSSPHGRPDGIERRESGGGGVGGETPTTTRPRRATGTRMLVYHAREKDCVDEDGEAQECVICFEEFEVGDELGRLECLCKFHRTCIRKWWETKGAGSCPTHQLHE